MNMEKISFRETGFLRFSVFEDGRDVGIVFRQSNGRWAFRHNGSNMDISKGTAMTNKFRETMINGRKCHFPAGKVTRRAIP